jgi:hypothetical protein
LRRTDADIVLKFLASSVRYNRPVDDPLYSAHKEVIFYDYSLGENTTLYAADSPLTAIGCSVQVRRALSTTATR